MSSIATRLAIVDSNRRITEKRLRRKAKRISLIITLILLVPQRLDGIHLGGPPRRQVTGEQRGQA